MIDAENDSEGELLRSVALQNASSILAARRQAETELVNAKEALRETADRLRAVFDQAAVGMAIAELDGRITEVNDRFLRILGYDRSDVSRLTVEGLISPEDRPAAQTRMRELVAGEQSDFAVEQQLVRKDGSLVWGRTSVNVLRDADGEANRFVGIIEDIGEQKAAEEALQKAAEERKQLLESERFARAEAERASAMKDEFLATLSHELRTPLSAILGWSQVLRFKTMSEAELRQGLETIERNARMQTQLIEDLLDMSRITSGKLRLEIQSVDVSATIDAAIETVKPAADAKGIPIQKLLDPDAGPISGDPARLQQIVWNLLSNAIKFTPRDGKIQVVLQRLNSNVEISVVDTGIGIKPEFIPYVFDRFRQADASTTRMFGGLGLGLSIVKHLAELHGGSVSVTSGGEGEGSTFTVRLPCVAVRRQSPAGDRVHPRGSGSGTADFHHSDLSGIKILIVDDAADARDLITRVLRECGAETLTASNGEEALRCVENERPQLLVSDIGMPDLDGYQLLRKVRELGPDRGGSIPAIALTAFARSEDRTRALRAGFLVHVSKPIETAELVATVASVVGRAAG
jgi:PAS domain S-box-containing protein